MKFSDEVIAHRCAKADLLYYSIGLQIGVCSRVEEMVTRQAPTGEILHVLAEHHALLQRWVDALQIYPSRDKEP